MEGRDGMPVIVDNQFEKPVLSCGVRQHYVSLAEREFWPRLKI